jgi:ankyrin repeat protein
MAEVEDLFAAIQKGDAARAAVLLDAEPALASARRQGASALLIARYHGRHDIVALLRAQRPALDVFEAAALGDTTRLTTLLDAEPGLANAVAEDGFGPLGLACFFDHEPAVRLLLARGARVDQASANGMRVMPLHSAAAARSVPIARLLLERGAPVNARQGQDGGFTPLMEAALNGQMELIDLLLQHGADPSMRDSDERAAADHARTRGHEEAARRLDHGERRSG